MSMTLEQAIEIAINDGINIYVREVLLKKGLLSTEQFYELGNPEFLNLKYKIAQEMAGGWGKMRLQLTILGLDEAPDLYIPVQPPA